MSYCDPVVAPAPRSQGSARRRAMAARDPLQLGNLEAVLSELANAITIPFVIPYAVALGAANWEVGLITALPLLVANLSQIPAARWGARSQHPRAYLLLAGGLGRVAWLGLALLLLAGRADYSAVLLVVTVASLSTGLLAPLWTSFLGKQVPEERRGSYFGTRNLLGGAAGLAGAFSAAWAVSTLGFAPGNGLALLLAAVAASGALAVQILAMAPASSASEDREHHRVRSDVGEWRTPAVRHYVIYGALLILGAGMSAPFFSVHFINDLRGAPETAATTMAVAGALVMLAQGLWGRIIDRWELKVVGAGSLAAIALVPALWLMAAEPLHGVPVWLFNGLMWAAAGLATFNLMLAISTDANRALVVAWVSALQAPVQFAAPLIGGLLAERAGIPALFLTSSAILGMAWLYFLYSVPASRRHSPDI